MYPGSDVFLQLAIIKFFGLLYEKGYCVGTKDCGEVFEDEIFKVLLKHFDGIVVAAV